MRILVIEDEHKIAQAIKKGLVHENYAVDVEYDGDKGYDMAAGEEYDVIVLDIMLPGKDGLTICKTLRKEGNHTPILLLTARGQVEDRVDGLDCGADDYLVKPFAFAELFARIRALVRRPRAAIPAVLTVGPLTLDTHSFSGLREHTQIALSGKEYAILEYLMRHKNQVVTKDQIIAHVWDYDADVLPNTVEVYIRHLRKKIDMPFSGPALIKTMKGFGGYSISEER